MTIECTVEELKELLTNKTSVARTTDENVKENAVGLIFKPDNKNIN